LRKQVVKAVRLNVVAVSAALAVEFWEDLMSPVTSSLATALILWVAVAPVEATVLYWEFVQALIAPASSLLLIDA
jgi:hypothetical protein